MNTVMERSHIALHKWLQAFHLMCSQQERHLRSPTASDFEHWNTKTAWFMCHRIREAMRDSGLGRWAGKARSSRPMKPITARSIRPRSAPRQLADGHSPRAASPAPPTSVPIVALVERGGNVRTFHVPVADQNDGREDRYPRTSRARNSRLHTDESKLYFNAGQTLSPRMRPCIIPRANTSDMKMSDAVHTNSAGKAISQFSSAECVASTSIAKRSIYTVIWRSLISDTIIASDLAFNDGERAVLAVKNAAGKRLTYRLRSLSRISDFRPRGLSAGERRRPRRGDPRQLELPFWGGDGE